MTRYLAGLAITCVLCGATWAGGNGPSRQGNRPGPGSRDLNPRDRDRGPMHNDPRSSPHYREFQQRSPEFYREYGDRHARRFSNGHFYEGREHRHWGHCYYEARWRVTFYYDPCFSCYYYWCERDCRFYPVCYIEYAPPTIDLGPF
jgi:hypothetical protein